MISLMENGAKFNYRTAGIAIHEDRVLLHRATYEDFWSLPGGRVNMMESAEAALIREMQEEINAVVTVERLVFVVENFFMYQGVRYHELAFYFLMHFAPDSPLWQHSQPFQGMEGGDIQLIFQWFPLKELSKHTIYPTVLAENLPHLDHGVRHLVGSG